VEVYRCFQPMPSWRGQGLLLPGMEGNIYCTVKCIRDRTVHRGKSALCIEEALEGLGPAAVFRTYLAVNKCCVVL
jgi:hypothetical protein